MTGETFPKPGLIPESQTDILNEALKKQIFKLKTRRVELGQKIKTEGVADGESARQELDQISMELGDLENKLKGPQKPESE